MKHKLNIADAVTASRIVFTVFIMVYPAFSMQFYIFYLLGAFTDMIDGWIAKTFKLKSSFGAKLDTFADFIFVVAVMVKVFSAFYVPKWPWIWITVIAFIKLTNLVSCLVTSHRLIPMHTVMNKITGFMLFILTFVISIGWCKILLISVIITCSVATLASIQEGHFIRIGKVTE